MANEQKFGYVIKDASVPSETILVDAVLTFHPMHLTASVKQLFSSCLQHKTSPSRAECVLPHALLSGQKGTNSNQKLSSLLCLLPT